MTQCYADGDFVVTSLFLFYSRFFYLLFIIVCSENFPLFIRRLKNAVCAKTKKVSRKISSSIFLSIVLKLDMKSDNLFTMNMKVKNLWT